MMILSNGSRRLWAWTLLALLAACGESSHTDRSSPSPEVGEVPGAPHAVAANWVTASAPSSDSTAIPEDPAATHPPDADTLHDIGIANFAQVDRGIFRGGRPTVAAIGELGKAGVRTVLSLEEYVADPPFLAIEQDALKAAGIKFLHVPMNGLLKPSPGQILAALALVHDPQNWPIFVHCLHGSDRTGLVIAAYRIKDQGWSVADATAEMYQHGHSKLLAWWDDVLNHI